MILIKAKRQFCNFEQVFDDYFSARLKEKELSEQGFEVTFFVLKNKNKVF